MDCKTCIFHSATLLGSDTLASGKKSAQRNSFPDQAGFDGVFRDV